MNSNDRVTLFHAPWSRSTGTLVLLEELNAPYDLQVLNMKAGEQRQSPYLSINPMGKVPALHHRGTLVTEQIAIALYLADLFPQAGLTPALDSSLRGPYLRWMVYYSSCYEPALVDRSLQREPAAKAMSPYCDFDTMLDIIATQLSKGPYLLGEKMTAADILWANALRWGTMFKLVPELPVIMDYIQRITSRPSFVKIIAMDNAWAEEHQRIVDQNKAELERQTA